MNQEVLFLRSEIESLKHKIQLKKEQNYNNQLNKAISKGIYTTEEVDQIHHVNKLLKVEHELYRLEHSHLVSSFKKNYESRLDERESQNKIMKSIRKNQVEEIKKINKKHSKSTNRILSKIKYLEYRLACERENFKVNEDKIKCVLLRVVNNRNNDLTFICERLKGLQINCHDEETSFVYEALYKNIELMNTIE